MDVMDIRRKHALPSADEAIPGRSERMEVTHAHTVLGTPLEGPFDASFEIAMFGLGCFWGAERRVLEGTWGVYDRSWVCGGAHS
jgi:peptide-methionine (S)-S-oxide reductase